MPTLAIAILLLAAAFYTQWTIPAFTRSAGHAWALRLFLVLVGIAVGVTLVRVNGGGGDDALAVFLLGFGVVHVPPALVLLLKRWRRESPS
jgi:hypothetical protein